MPIALTPGSSFEYQLVEDRKPDGKDNPDGTFFTLGALTPQDEAELQDKQFSWGATGEVVSYNIGSDTHARLLRGLRGCRNFLDAKGVAVPFEPVVTNGRARCSEEFLARLSVKHRSELASAHRTHFNLGAEEKN